MFMLLGMDANLCHILTNSLANQIVEFNFSVLRAEPNIFNEFILKNESLSVLLFISHINIEHIFHIYSLDFKGIPAQIGRSIEQNMQ